MSANQLLVSKVMILDDARAHSESLKAFCEECGLVGIRPQRVDESGVVAILDSNVALGGILLYENFGGEAGNGLKLARKINESRPELPIFLRRDSIASVAGLSEKDAAMFRCAYTLEDLQQLRAVLDTSIFSRIYPAELVRGIADMTRTSLETLFRNCDVVVETPYLVKDRVIYGEVFTMISIDSNWCRGYMMLQASEEYLLELLRRDSNGETVSVREMNNILAEATNLIWGSFKNRYAGHNHCVSNLACIQVPIIINHKRSYISFGSEDPQLCFKYSLWERNRADACAVPIYQRFIFNLNWSPEEFRENPTVESLVDSGEIEMF